MTIFLLLNSGPRQASNSSLSQRGGSKQDCTHKKDGGKCTGIGGCEDFDANNPLDGNPGDTLDFRPVGYDNCKNIYPNLINHCDNKPFRNNYEGCNSVLVGGGTN